MSVTELGSLLDHTGPHLEAEEYIARTFGAEQSYMVTNGTSTSTTPGMPQLWILAVFVAGVWSMRAAGCVVNDYADRKFDGHVKRT
ncbi:UbiA family prenyltransferase, partial [Salmonella enterica subsp. enterica serovar Anatum]|nr:UbiA family prenyltransferase [Salmonella enterica subsp. enterica serovar Anatum]